jgi:acetyl-CoA acetyltransferase
MRRSNAPEDIGILVALKDRLNALKNPYAHLHEPEITYDSIKESFMLWEPIRYAETCPSSDGAFAMVLPRLEHGWKVFPALREAIVQGETGRLVDFFSPAQLASETIALLGNAAERDRLGRNARQFAVEKYDLQSVCLPRQLEWVESLARTPATAVKVP